MTLKKWILPVAAVAVVAGVVVWKQLQPETVEVWVVSTERGAVESTVANTRAGTVKACRRSKLTMPVGGVVDRLLVDEGDHVDAGQLLLELWNRDREADLKQAQQTLKAASYDKESACLTAELKERDANRLIKLARDRLVSEEQVDSARTVAETQARACAAASNQAGVAQARVDYFQAVLERTQLRAPFAGVVAEINGEVGEYITPSPPGVATPAAVDLIDYSCLYVTAPIDEVDASALHTGLQARIALDAFRDQNLMGSLTRIAPYVLDLEKQARTVDVDVQFDHVPDDVALLVGYSADIILILDQRDNVLRIPTEAIMADNSVWVVDADNLLHKREITTGIGNWSWTEVSAGLSEGEQLVRNPDKAGIAEGVQARILAQ